MQRSVTFDVDQPFSTTLDHPPADEIDELLEAAKEHEYIEAKDDAGLVVGQYYDEENDAIYPVAGPKQPNRIPLANGQIPLSSSSAPLRPPEPQPEPEPEPQQPPPSRVKQAQVVAEISRQAAEARRAVLNDNNAAAKQMKAQKAFKKLADTELTEESAALARRMNAYREKYKKKIKFTFRPHYTATMGYQLLKSECDEVELILNTSDVPTFLKKLFLELTGVIELGVNFIAGAPVLVDLKDDFVKLAEPSTDEDGNFHEGHFDAELDQLSIEWAEYFAASASTRLLLKSSFVVFNRFKLNQSMGKSVDPRIVSNSQDL